MEAEQTKGKNVTKTPLVRAAAQPLDVGSYQFPRLETPAPVFAAPVGTGYLKMPKMSFVWGTRL